MIKRTIEISREATHLRVHNRQLILSRNGNTIGQAPCEDIGMVVVDHPQVTYTHAVFTELASAGAILVICGRAHLPVATVLPLADHSQVVWRLRDQLAAKRPLRKQLWRQLVVAKIGGQAHNLGKSTAACGKLLALAREVKSGDPTNIEARAAKLYWANWLAGEPFRRDADAGDLNIFLNYGYAILRAALARAIVTAGLLPSVGIHHRHRGNAFCLADDLIEPFRPLVDARVRDLHQRGCETLSQEVRAELLGLLTLPLRLADQVGPCMVMMYRYVGSLVKCFALEEKRLEIPLSETSFNASDNAPCELADTE